MGRLAASFVGVIAFGALAWSCGQPPTPEPEGTWVRADMMELPEGVAEADLPEPGTEGARLAARFCSQCHGTPSPLRHDASDWVPTLRRMFSRMDYMSGMGGMGPGMMGRGGMMGGRRMPMGMHGVDMPSPAEQRTLIEYYTSHALRSIEPSAAPAGEGAEAFGQSCSRCHALPDPALHSPGEWPAVVERMRQNMERMGVEGISDEEAGAIAEYLQRAGGRE